MFLTQKCMAIWSHSITQKTLTLWHVVCFLIMMTVLTLPIQAAIGELWDQGQTDSWLCNVACISSCRCALQWTPTLGPVQSGIGSRPPNYTDQNKWLEDEWIIMLIKWIYIISNREYMNKFSHITSKRAVALSFNIPEMLRATSLEGGI